MKKLKTYYRFLMTVLCFPIIFEEYFDSNTGRDYGVTLGKKISLLFKMYYNSRKIISATSVLEHLVLATKILNIPKSQKGCIVECGSYKGASTTNMSLLANLCNRDLEVFDSFQGLPQPSSVDKKHILVSEKMIATYRKGAWVGTLEEVKKNISQYGNINHCYFHAGFFEKTLPSFKKKCVFVFADVDLRSSLESCVKSLWSILQNGCYFFIHEAPHYETASLFFDKTWWVTQFACSPPGLIGAGSGIIIMPIKSMGVESGLGYVIKNPPTKKYKVSPQTGVK